ncbi:30S ribosomal protein S20 [Candidatus Liberibacter asiaticus]|uniref:Small ribosomal subunit protein bS20 n=2 Tax=Liberibacter asiaticus TaxID=34021 RepID=C6XFE6_LIBAP|nr:30S ribosomal protein S20 [Candidatus Liberibacter asiaticus]ACT57099.1 30S ribosomal protein S20 [Candidatus Liberibacter asiaticus str. psy62]AGH16936.1 30S ribosomal protein S20 [Candidatus Liberibacter asiaticus str. gxpsy]ALK07275.1 30S ribosomal protein S20 [Candidatus Liberibacter asiaticus]ASK52764.1 30S ribosomal protein S20 [Candidatus Liberibacter asiaticus]AWL14083.1 30S ribosomal protein S20 [Candidatus Liberibacter asiaticus]
MANKDSAKKMIRKIARRTLINKSRRSSVRSFMRHANEAITFGKIEEATEACRKAESVIQKAKSKGIFHGNAASRKVSRLSKRLKGILTSA